MVYASLVGAQVHRKEDPRLITGRAAYVGDLKLPGMHHVAFVRSPYAHARIRGIETASALRRPGVLTVVTGQDLAPHIEPVPWPIDSEPADAEANGQHSHYALSIDRVRHVGEAVAAVIATKPAVAVDGANDVVVHWELLPTVGHVERAVADDAPCLFDNMSGNVAHVWSRNKGDVEAAFASAFRVVRQRMVNQRLAGIPMEGRAVVAAPDLATGGLTFWISTQAPHLARSKLAQVLRMPENMIRVIAPEVGGGFGLKIQVYPEDIVLAWLAHEYQRPLRWVETRTEHMVASSQGRGQVAEVSAAVQEDGQVTALQMRILADLGAYPVFLNIPTLTGAMAVGVYQIPAVDLEISCVFTNTPPVGAYRGAGRPEAAYYIERLMDLVADELETNPAEVRRKNFIPPEAFPYKTPTGQIYDSGGYDQALTKVLAMANYPSLRAEQSQRIAQNTPQLLGIGIACYVEMCAFGPYESAVVRVEPSGTVTVYTGISPHGQGQETTFAQIVADQLGLDYEQILVRHGDTAITAMGLGTMGSRGLAIGGSALVRAVDKVRAKAKRIAAHMLEAAPEDIVLQEGRYQVRGVPNRALTLAKIAHRAYTDQLPEDMDSGLEATDFFRPPRPIYPFGAHIAVVEVERETGFVCIRNYYTVDDCGPRISPQLVEGQVHGGLAQGIAQALLEEMLYDESGQLLSGSLLDYAVPRADHFPLFLTDKTETPTPNNPLGVKGIGEAATIGSTPAVVNAVLDALKPFGVRHIDMPLRAEKIWRVIQASRTIN